MRIRWRGLELPSRVACNRESLSDTFGEFQLSYRYGDILIPRLDDAEPLKVACQHFVDCVEKGIAPRSSGVHGLNVVRVLEAAVESIREDGRLISVEPIGSGLAGTDEA